MLTKTNPAKAPAESREIEKLRSRNEELRRRNDELVLYLRHKIDQMLEVIGTLPLRPDELDEAGIISLDPIGIIAESFTQILQSQREANARVKLAHDKIDAIYNSVGAGIVVLDSERRILSHNRRLKELFFPEKRSVTGHTCVSVMCRSDLPLKGCVFGKVLASGQRERTAEWPFAGHFYDVVGMPVKDGRGKIFQVVIVYHDVTERKKVELELCDALEQAQESREQIHAILSSIHEGMLVTDRNGTVTVANPAATKILGSHHLELVGSRIDEFFAGSDIMQRIAAACTGDEPGEPFDAAVYTPDMHKRLFQARLAMLHTSTGEVRGTVVTLLDVTREREVEAMKTDFISTAAHELRTPVTSIVGFSELLLQNGTFSEEMRREFVQMINGKAEDLASLIDDLLDLSRVEDGRDIPLACTAVDLLPVISTSLAFFRRRFPLHRFDIDFPLEPLIAHADRRRLAQILENLLSNAVKYSPSGGTVTVSLQPEGEMCAVSVADTGIGMTEEQVGRIFEKFYRANSSNTAPPGSGLGMSIVKKLVTGHGGDIFVNSSPGAGTTITFTLPRIHPE